VARLGVQALRRRLAILRPRPQSEPELRRQILERRADNPPYTKRPRGRIWGSQGVLASRANSTAFRPSWTPCPPSRALTLPPSQPMEQPSARSAGSRPQGSRAGEVEEARTSRSQYPTCCSARKERTVHISARSSGCSSRRRGTNPCMGGDRRSNPGAAPMASIAKSARRRWRVTWAS
jgi:hypothetical protein